MSNLRITEDGDYRITEGGDYRILEGVDIGQVTLTAPAGAGTVSTNTPGAVGGVTVTTPQGAAVGYTSAVAAGGFPTQTITAPAASLVAGFNGSLSLPTVTVEPILCVAGGGGQATPAGSVGQIVVSRVLPGTLTGGSDTSVGIPTGPTVTGVEGAATGESLASPDIPSVTSTTPEADVSAGVDFDPDIGIVAVATPTGEAMILGEGEVGTITVSGIDGEAGAFNYAEGYLGTVTVSVPRVSTGKRIKVAEALFRGLENYDAIRQIRKSN